MAVVMYIGHTIRNSPAILLQMFKLQCDRQVAGMLALSMQAIMHVAYMLNVRHAHGLLLV